MNRRSTITNPAVATGGWITLPFWMTACRISDKAVHYSSFSTAEQATLAALTDTIIPVGPSIGALSARVDKFLQKMIDDCYGKSVQDKVKKQLAVVEASFAAATARQRKEILLKGLGSASKDEKDFFTLLKSETIRGFNISQRVMEGYRTQQLDVKNAAGLVKEAIKRGLL